ncbi:MAG: aspartate aminotransferase family protein [Gammaproteobacteria bacterium]|nr:aspartate aminotransferase family protein [Gammaproteobacteria bacterium]
MSHLMPTYSRLPVTFTQGEGVWLWDDQNNRYLDAISGIAVCNLGHCHPAVTQAICQQASQLVHTSNLYQIQRQEELGDALVEASGMDKVFFCNSGTEANEAAIKLARLYGHKKGIALPTIVVMENSFHGRTMAALTATGNEKIKEGFGPMLEGFLRVPYNDINAAEQAFANNPNIVAVLVEPVQGEGGVLPADPAWCQRLRDLCQTQDALMMIDEVQTGMGRTGKLFAFQHHQFLPDVVTLAKGLGNGMPIGAMMTRGKAAEVFAPGNHGTTFGGNPLACAAGLAVLNTLRQHPEHITNATELGNFMRAEFIRRLANLNGIKVIRGLGLMIGIQLDRPCAELVKRALEKHHLLINVTRGDTVRLLPPLVMTQDDAELIVSGVCDVIREFLNTNA